TNSLHASHISTYATLQRAGGLNLQLTDRTHLHAALARRRDLRGDLNGIVEIPRLDEVEAGQLLLGFRKRSVGDRHSAVPHANRRRRFDRLQRLGGEERTVAPQLLAAGKALCVLNRPQLLLFQINEAQILHETPWFWEGTAFMPAQGLLIVFQSTAARVPAASTSTLADFKLGHR